MIIFKAKTENEFINDFDSRLRMEEVLNKQFVI